MSVLVYCACVLAAATAAMTVAISLPQVLRLPVLSRALLGLALTPFALGTLGLIVVAIWPRSRYRHIGRESGNADLGRWPGGAADPGSIDQRACA